MNSIGFAGVYVAPHRSLACTYYMPLNLRAEGKKCKCSSCLDLLSVLQTVSCCGVFIADWLSNSFLLDRVLP